MDPIPFRQVSPAWARRRPPLPQPDPDNLERALVLLDEIGGALATVALLLMTEQEARGRDG